MLIEWDFTINVATLLPLVLAPLAYFVKKFLEKRSHNRRVSRNLYEELQDGLRALTARKPTYRHYNNQKYEFVAAYLNHDIYDSLINSGEINFLDHELQQEVQNVFKKIKEHNRFLDRLILLEESIEKSDSGHESLIPIIEKYCSLLIKFESDIKKTVPIIADGLKSRFPAM